MSRAGDLMRRSLKRHLVPAMHSLGFEGSRSLFRRTSDQWLDVVELQYYKYGGEFILEAARRPRGDLKTAWGPIVPEKELTIGHFPIEDRARLEPRPSTTLYRGFVFTDFKEDLNCYDRLAAHVAELIPQLDYWLVSRVVGPNTLILFSRPQTP